MKSKIKSVLLVVFALFPLQALASDTSINRSEDIGVVRGTINKENYNLASIPEIYNSSRANMARVYGFNAKYPLEVNLSDSSYRTCRRFFKDESYTADEYTAFLEKYAGTRVQLSGVQRHFGVAGPIDCTFTGLEVLASKEEVASKEVKQQKAKQAESKATGDYAIGDMAVSVFYLGRNFVRFRMLDEDGTPVQKPNHECAGVAVIKKALNGEQIRAIRAETKKVGHRATLKNVVVKDGKCTVEAVVPLSQ